MDNEFLAKKRKWIRSFLFPFKAFLILVALITCFQPDALNGSGWSENLVFYGILASFLCLTLGGIAQLTFYWRDAIDTFFVFVIFFILLAIGNPSHRSILSI